MRAMEKIGIRIVDGHGSAHPLVRVGRSDEASRARRHRACSPLKYS